MSETVEGKTAVTVINGSNNIIEVKGDMNVIGRLTYQSFLPSILPQEASIWFEVRRPVESFTGRKRELEILHNEVQRKKRKNERNLTVISQMTSIVGLGGIGKSELARMYACKHSHDYDGNVIWINAESYGTLTESFRRLAKDKLNISTKSIDGQEKDISSIVQDVYKCFSKRKCLFIFDNVEKLRTEGKQDEGIDMFLPNFQPIDDNAPYIIITSRTKEWGKTIEVIMLKVFTEEEAIEFIKKELDLSEELYGKEMHQLAKILQCFPLALQQAVAYIKQTDEKLKEAFDEKFKIIDYLKSYEKEAKELLNSGFLEDNSNLYFETTFTTWKTTLERIKQNEYGQQALEILETIAYFEPDNIPTKIFLELVMDDKKRLVSVLKLLSKYSMVNLDKGVVNIHRLVQQVIRLDLKDQQNEQKTLKKALKLIKTSIEEQNAESSKCLPHAISVWNHATNNDNKILTEELIEFSTRIIYKLANDTRYQEAFAFGMQTLKLQRGTLRIDLSTLNTEHNITLVHEISQELLKLNEHFLGKEHPSTLLTKYIIAGIQFLRGKFDESLSIFQEVFNIQERTLGAEHPDTLATRSRIAGVQYNQGKYYDALRILQEVFNTQERVLGPENPSTLNTRHIMTLVLDKMGKHNEALVIFKEVFKARERALGAEHPSTLSSKHDIGLALDRKGEYEEALVIFQEIFIIQEHVLGAEHIGTLNTRYRIAGVLYNQGKYDEALLILQDVLNIQGRALGVEHPDTLTSRHDVALALDKKGEYDEALLILKEVFNIRERVLGAEHPDTLATRYRIASVLSNQSKYDEALRILQEVFNIQERVLGRDHPDTLATMERLTSTNELV